MTMNYYVYLLANASNVALYVGITNNLLRRVAEHRSGADPNSHTARYGIHKLVYSIEKRIATPVCGLVRNDRTEDAHDDVPAYRVEHFL